MTTPGGVPNLPQGALTINTLKSKTQDMSPTAMKARAAERISSIFGGSTGSDPMSASTPFGFLTTLFAGFQSTVANADPNDINGPEDLPGLLVDFIESLPVVGEFVRLLDAIKGTYEGDDQTLLAVQTFFVSLRADIEQAEIKADAAADKWAQSIDQLLGMGHGVEDFINMLQGLRDGNLSFLAPANTNRLDNPNFNGALSLSDPSGDFVWDANVSRSGGAGSGSARADADGNEKELRSNKVSVASGQVWTFVANIASVALAGSGALVQLTALPFDSAGNELPPVVLASSGVPAGSGVWVSPPAGANKTAQLTSDWTVPANVTRVSLRMVLTATATAGQIWLDDMSLSAKNPIPQDWVKNLVNDLNTTFTRFTQMGQIVSGQIITAYDSFVQDFKDWWASNLGPSAIKAKADQNAAWAARKAQNDKILNDWSFYYPFGSPSDTAATLVGGKRTRWGAWNDNIAIMTEQLGFAPPTAPLVDAPAAVKQSSDAVVSIAGTGSVGTVSPTSITDQLLPAQVAGPDGSSDLDATVARLFSQLGTALDGSVDGADDLATLAGLVQQLHTRAMNAETQAASATSALAIKNNSPLRDGFDNTVQSNMSIFDMLASSSTELYSNPVGFVRVTKPGRIGAIKFCCYLYSSGTDLHNPLYVNVFRVDYANSMLRYLYSTGDVNTLVTAASSSTSPKFQRILLPGVSNFDVVPGDVIAVELSSTFGTTNGYRRACGATVNFTDPNALTTTFGARYPRGGAGAQATADVAFSVLTLQGSAPYIGLEITNTPASYVATDRQQFVNTSGSTWNMPAGFKAGDLVRVIGVGGGGGGGFQNSGAPGSWAVTTLVIGTDIPVGASLAVVAGLGGTHTYPARDGAPSTVKYGSTTLLSAAGGADYANYQSSAQSPGNQDYPPSAPVTYFGGGNVGFRQNGSKPGGGGSWTGDANASYNTFGGNGKVWIVTEQAA